MTGLDCLIHQSLLSALILRTLDDARLVPRRGHHFLVSQDCLCDLQLDRFALLDHCRALRPNHRAGPQPNHFTSLQLQTPKCSHSSAGESAFLSSIILTIALATVGAIGPSGC